MSEAHQVLSVLKRPGRPTKLLAERTRSESPGTRSTIRPSDLGSSPATDVRCDLDAIQKMFKDSNGVLCFGNERMLAGKEDFNCEKVLAYGNCSEVRKVRHRSRRDLVMAVKVMYLSSNSEEENKLIFSDLNVVTQINQFPFIVNYYGILFTGVEFWICMELMPTCLGRLLRDLSDPFPENVIGKVVVSIVSALDYLKQKHSVIHRDVKPSNMLLGYRGEVKLCDFGISGKLQDSITRSASLGCIRYMAPERLNKQEYDVRADVWSLGVSILELATGSFPYRGATTEFALMMKIVEEEAPRLPLNFAVSKEFRHFVEMCLQKEVKRRPKYAKLKQSEFFQLHNVEPFNVLDWLQTLKLAHLRQSFTSSALSDVASGSVTDPSVSAELDRLCTATPTPDVSCVYVNGTNDAEHADGPSKPKGDTRSDVLDMDRVAVPTTISSHDHFNSTNMPYDVGQVDNKDKTRFTKPHDCQAFVPPVLKVNDVFHCNNGPSAAVDSSSCTALPKDHLTPSTYYRPTLLCDTNLLSHHALRIAPNKFHASIVHPGSLTNGPAFKQRPQGLHPLSVPDRESEIPVPSSDSDHSVASHSPTSFSRPAPHTPHQVNSTLPKASEQSNPTRTHKSYKHLEMTPSNNEPLFQSWQSKPILDKSYACPSQHQSRQPPSQTRSASVGAQLRRSHARRWQCKPGDSTNYDHAGKHPDQPQNHPEPCSLADQGETRNCTSVLKPTSATMAPQQYHHHYYYYFYKQAAGMSAVTPGSPRAVTPPLPLRGSYSRYNDESVVAPSIRFPVSAGKSDANLLLSGRLAHRLHTHPPPRQNGYMHHIRQPEQNTQSPPLLNPVCYQHPSFPPSEQSCISFRHHLPTRLINCPDTIRTRDPVRGHLSQPARGSHRSSSQPANSHYWLSFETEL